MHKLVIMIESPEDEPAFDDRWPEFLHHSERMPGLLREATSRVEEFLYGNYHPYLLHELFFESLDAIQAAMGSPEGRAAGQVLQQMSSGRMTLVIADHKEDDIVNIRRYQAQPSENEQS